LTNKGEKINQVPPLMNFVHRSKVKNKVINVFSYFTTIAIWLLNQVYVLRKYLGEGSLKIYSYQY